MCDPQGGFKLCTCGSDPDTSRPYWVLKMNIEARPYPEIINAHIVGEAVVEYRVKHAEVKKSKPDVNSMLLEYLNEGKVFDFEYTPLRGDYLKIVTDPSRDTFYEFEYNGSSWVKGKGIGGIGLDADHRTRKGGFS